MLRIAILLSALAGCTASLVVIPSESGQGTAGVLVGLVCLFVGLVTSVALTRLPLSRAARRLGLEYSPRLGFSGLREGARIQVSRRSRGLRGAPLEYTITRSELTWLPVSIAPETTATSLAKLVGRRDLAIGNPRLDRALRLDGNPLVLRLLLAGRAGERVAELVQGHNLRWQGGTAATTTSRFDLRTAKIVRVCEAGVELGRVMVGAAQALAGQLLEVALTSTTWHGAHEALDLLRKCPIGTGAARARAQRVLRDPDERRRVIAAWALCRPRGDNDWVAPHEAARCLLELAAHAEGADVRALALTLSLRDESALPLLRQSVEGTSDLVAATAARALLRLGYATLDEIEPSHLGPARNPLPAHTIGALRGDSALAEPTLIALLEHPDEAVVKDALAALTDLGGHPTLKALSAVGEVSPRVARQLEVTRKALRGRLGGGHGGALALAAEGEGGGLALAGVEEGGLSVLAETAGGADLGGGASETAAAASPANARTTPR